MNVERHKQRQVRVFSLGPRVTKQDGCLIASTAWLVRVLTLGTMLQTVVVDLKKSRVLIRGRYLWLFARSRKIPFKAVTAVTYGYEDLSLGGSWSAHNAIDSYSVGLRLYDGEDVRLFSFTGDGSFVNNGPWPDWMYWSEFTFDWTGNQESRSRAFVEILSTMLNVSIVPPR